MNKLIRKAQEQKEINAKAKKYGIETTDPYFQKQAVKAAELAAKAVKQAVYQDTDKEDLNKSLAAQV